MFLIFVLGFLSSALISGLIAYGWCKRDNNFVAEYHRNRVLQIVARLAPAVFFIEVIIFFYFKWK
jgi:hypothetical protein